MRTLVDNPVARHTWRFTPKRYLPWIILAFLAGVTVLAGVMQQYWMQYPIYSGGEVRVYRHWLFLFLLAQTPVLLSWAMVRGALVWRRLIQDGHLEEYRRSRMSAASVVLGAWIGSLRPLLLALAASLALSSVVVAAFQKYQSPEDWDYMPGLSGLAVGAVAYGHLLLLAVTAAFAALGLALSGHLRSPAMAVPIGLATFAVACTLVWPLNFVLRGMSSAAATKLTYASLVPNPITAVGEVIGVDLMRYPLVYPLISAHEWVDFTFRYPSGATVVFYGVLAAAALSLLGRRVARMPQ